MANFFNNIDEILKKKVFWVRISHRKCLSNIIICYGLLERYFVLSIYMYIKLNNIKKRLTRIAFSVLPLVTVVTLQPLLPMTDRITTYNTRIMKYMQEIVGFPIYHLNAKPRYFSHFFLKPKFAFIFSKCSII